jgi:hypothetical protein
VKAVKQRSAPPSHINRLLQALIKDLNLVPTDAEVVHHFSELPAPWMHNLIGAAMEPDRGWRCWMDNRLRVWLFLAELSLPLSREMRTPVLQVNFYRESGLQDSGHWSVDRRSKWHRCAVKSQLPPQPASPTADKLRRIDFYRPSSARKVR